MIRVEPGMMARSKAGRDRGRIYDIIECDGTYAWLVDGEKRTVEHPKKKKLKHLQVIYNRKNTAEMQTIMMSEQED